MRVNYLLLAFCISVAGIVASCSKDDKIDVVTHVPVIVLESETATYNVKVGQSLTIAPLYQYAENAAFSWSEKGKIISTSRELHYTWAEKGEKFVTLTVANRCGETVMEIKVNVLEKLLPVITYNVPEEGLNIMKGVAFTFEPTVVNDEKATYAWYVNNQKVAETKTYSYLSNVVGEYTVKYVVTNEDGSTEFVFTVNVCNPEDLPFSWNFERETYYLSSGRTIRIIARNVQNDFDGTYSFTLNGSEVKKGKDKFYLFDKTAQGEYNLVVTMKNQYTTHTKNLKIVVCPPEGTYKRGVTSSSNVRLNKVYEFLAAPGQFINEGYSATTMEQACAYAEGRIIGGAGEQYVSLGAWGGSIVVGFDHSIVNDGGYNIQIRGNAFDGSSEPGIVWVMQDENGNGLPDDTWYELKGSDYDKANKEYFITYFKPDGTGMPVQWVDSEGETGQIDYLASYHKQDYYYPEWVAGPSYTLYGTRLIAKTTQNSSGIWINAGFDWGYADNWSTSDMIDKSSTTSNHFRISDAVRWDGTPANLKYIDFVKVQTGVNAKAGIIGENSTEVQDFKDYNLIK